MKTKQTNSRLKSKFQISQVNSDSKHLPIESLEEGATYQSHVKHIVKIISINHNTKVIKFRNISNSCNDFTEFKNVNLIKRF